MVALIVVHPVDAATVVGSAEILVDRLTPTCFVVRKVEDVEPLAILLIDPDGRVRAGCLHRAPIDATGRAPDWCVLGPEPRQIAEGMDVPTLPSDHPTQDVQVVAGLGQDDGGAGHAVVPVSPDIGVRHVKGFDGLQVLYAHDLSNGAGLDQLSHLDEVGSVPEHVADGDDAPRLPSEGKDVPALFFGWGDRFLEQDVVAQPEGLHTRAVVEIVRRADDHRVSELRPVEDMLPGREPALRGDPVGTGVALLANLHRLGHPHDLETVGIGEGVRTVGVAARSGPERDGGYVAVGSEVTMLVGQNERLSVLVARVQRPGEEGPAHQNAQRLQ
jgi:hypothetical protein